MMLVLISALFFSAPLTSLPLIELQTLGLPKHTRQVVFVGVDSWDSQTGILRMLDKEGDRWVSHGADIPVVLGSHGLAWGRGLQSPVVDGPQKVEGDGKAPAGIFPLGTAFGYDPQPPQYCRLPYRQATAGDYFVDDADSTQYNQWVHLSDAQDPAHVWKSFEKMRRDDQLYELGMVIEQNTAPVEAGKGSAVFFHVWRAADAPTAGCTAMSKDNLIKLLTWLDPAKRPLVIQVPFKKVAKLHIPAR
jgi:D-alanyl-D-alanine dipeptidase